MQAPLTKSTTIQQTFGGCGLGGVGLLGVEVLVGLGLSGRQARVYLGLLRSGVVGVGGVSVLSGVHRSEVYRVLEGLQELGLVQKNMTNPATFNVTPVDAAVKLLLDQKTNDLCALSRKAEQLTLKLNKNNQGSNEVTLRPCFGTIFEADRGRKYCKTIKNTEHTIEAVTSWRRFKQLCVHFESQLENALKRGVTIQIITEKPSSHHLPKWVNIALAKYPDFKLKIQPNQPEAAITIFDHNQAAIAYNPNTSLTTGPDLWTSNPTITTIAQAYFNTIWASLPKNEVKS